MFVLLLCISQAFAFTTVKLNTGQFDAFVKAIDNIDIAITDGDFAVDVDLTEVVAAIGFTNAKLDQAFDEAVLMHRDLGALLTTVASEITTTNLKISEVVKNQEKAAVQSDEHLHAFTTTLGSFLTPITQILTDVKNAVDLAKDAVSAFQEIFIATDEEDDVTIDLISTNVEIIATQFELGMKAVVAEAILGSSMSVVGIECAAFEGDACVSVLGEGPIACAGTELELCEFEGLILEPILKEEKV